MILGAIVAIGLGVVIAVVVTRSGAAPASSPGARVAASGSPRDAGTVAPRPDAGSSAVPAPNPPTAVREGEPMLSAVGDFWLYPRSDGSVRVVSPLVEVTFPHRPVVTLQPSPTKTADGKDFDVYRFTDEPASGVMRRLEVISLGRNARIVAGNATRDSFEKVGTVKETASEEQGVLIKDLEVVDREGTRLRARIATDLPRGVLMILTTLSPAGSAEDQLDDVTRASMHLRKAPEPTTDPMVLGGTTAVKKAKQFVVRDRAGTFSVTLPWPAKIVRTIKQKTVLLELHAKSGKASIDLTFAEWSSGDFLRETHQAKTTEKMRTSLAEALGMPFEIVPAKLDWLEASLVRPAGKLPKRVGRLETWIAPDRSSRRLVSVQCVDAPCAAVVKSLVLARPVPPGAARGD